MFILTSILFFSAYEGLADQYLWPAWSQYKLTLLVITQALFFISSLKFSDEFLEQKNRASPFHWLFYDFMGVWMLVILLVPFSSYGFMSKVTAPFILATPALAAIAGIHSVRKKYYPARFYLISWSGYISGIIIAELVRLGFIPSTPFTERSFHLGLMWLVLMWSLALADRIKMLKAETEGANLELSRSQNQLTQILEGLPLGVSVYGKERKPTFMNRRAIDIRPIQSEAWSRALLPGALWQKLRNISPSGRSALTRDIPWKNYQSGRPLKAISPRWTISKPTWLTGASRWKFGRIR